VRGAGDWEGWIAYYLEGVAGIADEAASLIGTLFELTDRDRRRFIASADATIMGARLFEHLLHHPIVTVKSAVRLCATTRPTATKAIDALRAAGILEETTGRGRDRAFSYRAYLDRLCADTGLGD
jgi:Fic family protein